nr:hypothetical protein CFP56_04028 [Quercus suber]
MGIPYDFVASIESDSCRAMGRKPYSPPHYAVHKMLQALSFRARLVKRAWSIFRIRRRPLDQPLRLWPVVAVGFDVTEHVEHGLAVGIGQKSRKHLFGYLLVFDRLPARRGHGLYNLRQRVDAAGGAEGLSGVSLGIRKDGADKFARIFGDVDQRQRRVGSDEVRYSELAVGPAPRSHVALEVLHEAAGREEGRRDGETLDVRLHRILTVERANGQSALGDLGRRGDGAVDVKLCAGGHGCIGDVLALCGLLVLTAGRVDRDCHAEDCVGTMHGTLDGGCLVQMGLHDLDAFCRECLSGCFLCIASDAADAVSLGELSIIEHMRDDRSSLLARDTKDDKQVGHHVRSNE